MLIKFVVKNIKKNGLTDAKQAYITNLFKLCRFTVNFFKAIFISSILSFSIFMLITNDFTCACTGFFVTMICGTASMFTTAIITHTILFIKYLKSKKEIERAE